MQTLTRDQLIHQLQQAQQGSVDAAALARWAFDQFYGEEAGTVEYETGYRRVIAAVLDELMFGDEPAFLLSAADLAQQIERLRNATPVVGDEDDEDDKDDEDDDSPEVAG